MTVVVVVERLLFAEMSSTQDTTTDSPAPTKEAMGVLIHRSHRIIFPEPPADSTREAG